MKMEGFFLMFIAFYTIIFGVVYYHLIKVVAVIRKVNGLIERIDLTEDFSKFQLEAIKQAVPIIERKGLTIKYSQRNTPKKYKKNRFHLKHEHMYAVTIQDLTEYANKELSEGRAKFIEWLAKQEPRYFDLVEIIKRGDCKMLKNQKASAYFRALDKCDQKIENVKGMREQSRHRLGELEEERNRIRQTKVKNDIKYVSGNVCTKNPEIRMSWQTHLRTNGGSLELAEYLWEANRIGRKVHRATCKINRLYYRLRKYEAEKERIEKHGFIEFGNI